MKKILALSAAVVMATTLGAQSKTAPYEFTDEKVCEISAVKSQANTGTCWCYATIAMLESDLMREGKGEIDLAEMWIVRQVYYDKVVKYVRMHGETNLEQGGNAHDVPFTMAAIGVVPEEAYPGLNYGTETHAHSELVKVLIAYANAIISNPNGQLSTAWKDGLNGILDAYFGVRPEKFTYNGKEYTPMSFAQELGLVADDYITITSYNHKPFYTQFALEIPDNWAWGTSYNVPIDIMQQICDESLEAGYVVGWNADVSEPCYLYSQGFAVLPKDATVRLKGSDMERLTGRRGPAVKVVSEPVEEVEVTQCYRQETFDDYRTTDDHSMLLYGLAKDQNGNRFYKTKNSWGDSNPLGGSFYTSKPFMIAKATTLTINKKSLSSEMKAKLGIK